MSTDEQRGPFTEAGRALYDHLLEVHRAGYIGGTTWDRIDRGILAIEAEAGAECDRRIKESWRAALGDKP